MRVYWPRSTRTQRRFRPVGPGGTRRYTGAVRKFLPTVQEAAVSAAMRVVPRVLFKNLLKALVSQSNALRDGDFFRSSKAKQKEELLQ